jgi:hypothetical protein
MMATRFDTIKRIALQGMSVNDFLAIPCDVSTGDCSMAQRCGESNPEAIDRARRARARASADHARMLDRLQLARQAVFGAYDLDTLRAALNRFNSGADDDLSIHVKHMLRMIDRRA